MLRNRLVTAVFDLKNGATFVQRRLGNLEASSNRQHTGITSI